MQDLLLATSPCGSRDGRCPIGNIYGTATLGGTAGVGTVYMLDTARNESIIHNFTAVGSDQYPGALVRDPAGNLYGTTTGDDIDGYSGEVFKVNSN